MFAIDRMLSTVVHRIWYHHNDNIITLCGKEGWRHNHLIKSKHIANICYRPCQICWPDSQEYYDLLSLSMVPYASRKKSNRGSSPLNVLGIETDMQPIRLGTPLEKDNAGKGENNGLPSL